MPDQHELPAEVVRKVRSEIGKALTKSFARDRAYSLPDAARAALSALEPHYAAEIAAAEKRGAVAGIRYAAMEKVGGFARDRLLTYADQIEKES